MTLPNEVQRAFQQAFARATAFNPRMAELRKRLLQEGGQEVFFEYAEPDVDALLETGKVFPHRIIGYPGKNSACHQNVARLWQKESKRFRIATGYALNQYGIWIQHSWLIDSSLTLYETAGTAFDSYFGIIYSNEQAQRFIRDVPR